MSIVPYLIGFFFIEVTLKKVFLSMGLTSIVVDEVDRSGRICSAHKLSPKNYCLE